MKKRASTFSGCHKTVIGGHTTIAWACRGCGKRACASCVNHYHPWTRSEPTRELTCGDCLRKERSLQRIEFNVGKLTPKRREDRLLLSPDALELVAKDKDLLCTMAMATVPLGADVLGEDFFSSVLGGCLGTHGDGTRGDDDFGDCPNRPRRTT